MALISYASTYWITPPKNGYGVPAFNVNNLEQTRAIMEAANETNSPVIMQASAGARKYAGRSLSCGHMMAAAIERVSAYSCGHSPGPRRIDLPFASDQSSWVSAQ